MAPRVSASFTFAERGAPAPARQLGLARLGGAGGEGGARGGGQTSPASRAELSRAERASRNGWTWRERERDVRPICTGRGRHVRPNCTGGGGGRLAAPAQPALAPALAPRPAVPPRPARAQRQRPRCHNIWCPCQHCFGVRNRGCLAQLQVQRLDLPHEGEGAARSGVHERVLSRCQLRARTAAASESCTSGAGAGASLRGGSEDGRCSRAAL